MSIPQAAVWGRVGWTDWCLFPRRRCGAVWSGLTGVYSPGCGVGPCGVGARCGQRGHGSPSGRRNAGGSAMLPDNYTRRQTQTRRVMAESVSQETRSQPGQVGIQDSVPGESPRIHGFVTRSCWSHTCLMRHLSTMQASVRRCAGQAARSSLLTVVMCRGRRGVPMAAESAPVQR